MLIKGPWILTQDPSRRILKKDVFISGNRIDEINGSISARSEYKIHAEGKILSPGLINTHTHVAMGKMRGAADDIPLGEFLERTFAMDAGRSRGDIYSASLLGMREMARTGTTSFLDLYYSEDIIAAAAKKAKMRAFLSWVALDKDKTTQKGDPLGNADNFIRKFKGGKGLISAGIGLQGIYACGDDTIVKASEIAEHHGVVMPMHVAETKAEVENARRNHKHGVVEHLAGLEVLNSRFMAVHSVHVSGREISLLAKTGTKISHNPVSNMKLGNGTAPVSRMLRQGLTITLGTDSVASNNNLDMFSTMKFASLLQKNTLRRASALKAQKIVDFATIDAARALNAGSSLGSVEEGKTADVIIIDPFPNALPVSGGNIVSNMVYSLTGLNTDTTIVDGVPLMLEKRLLV